MAITTYTSPARIEDVKDHSVNRPKCGNKMTVRNYFKKRKKELVLTTCLCYSGCLNVDPEPGEFKEYFFVAYNASDAQNVADRLRKQPNNG